MTPIEIIAFIIALIAVIKIIVLSLNPKSWMKFPRMINKQPAITMMLSLVLAAIVLYYLLAELTIVHIFAVMFFVMLLLLFTFSAFSKELVEMADKLLKDKSVLKKAWLPTIVWTILLIWVLYALFV